MQNGSSRLDQVVQTLKQSGHRVTPQRLAILRELADSRSHPSVETVYAAVKPHFPTTSLATVYKTVSLLKELGEIMEMGYEDGSNRYDCRLPTPHPHLVCTNCRTIIDTDLENLSHWTERLTEKTGYQIMRHRVDFFGICPDCQKKMPS